MKQVRFFPNDLCGLQVREDENGQQSREVNGRAIVFGVRSVNLTPWSSTRVVYEVLEPGCLTQELINRSDVIYNLNHNSSVLNVLGRFRNSEKDTLKLELRADGVYNSCELPQTTAANDALELIKRGDINGQSFAFEDDYEDTENGVSYERTNETIDGKEVWIRHVKRITGLYDVSIATHPAYVLSSRQVRGIRKYSSPKPMAATAALAGMGLTSENSARIRGSSLHCSAAAPAISPAKNRSLISTVRRGTTLDTTLIQPAAPIASMGTVRASSPE